MSATSSTNGKLPCAVIVAGATASGKSALALKIAEEFRGTIINADSQQRYRDLQVLTARPAPLDIMRVPHALFGDLGAMEMSSAGAWSRAAADEIQNAWTHGYLPIVTGGTGLYLRALTDGLAEIPATPPEVRADARALLERIGNAAFHAEVAARDPEIAARLAVNDSQRLLRAWEVAEATGTPLSVWQQSPTQPPAAARYFKILLLPPRDEVNAVCDARFVAMVANGAIDEVKALRDRGIGLEAPVMKALGAVELARYLAGDLDLEQAVAAAQAVTRRYAKQQITWFKYQFNADLAISTQFSESLIQEIFPKIRHFLLTSSEARA